MRPSHPSNGSRVDGFCSREGDKKVFKPPIQTKGASASPMSPSKGKKNAILHEGIGQDLGEPMTLGQGRRAASPGLIGGLQTHGSTGDARASIRNVLVADESTHLFDEIVFSRHIPRSAERRHLYLEDSRVPRRPNLESHRTQRGLDLGFIHIQTQLGAEAGGSERDRRRTRTTRRRSRSRVERRSGAPSARYAALHGDLV